MTPGSEDGSSPSDSYSDHAMRRYTVLPAARTTRPPGASRPASSTSTSRPREIRASVAIAPVGPVPMTTTSASATELPAEDDGAQAHDDARIRSWILEQAGVAPQVLVGADPDEDGRDFGERSDEGDRQLVEPQSGGGGKVAQFLDRRRSGVVGHDLGVARGGGEQSAAEHAARPDVGRTVGESWEQLVGGLGVEDAEGHLQRIDGGHGEPRRSLSDVLGTDSERQHLAGVTQVDELAEQIRHDVVRPVQLVAVDAVGAQAAQRA